MSLKKRSFRRKYMSIITPILLVLVTFYGLTYGPVPISMKEIWQVFFQDGDSIHKTIIIDVRLPRVIIGILVGACLATSGALLQGVMKNPLADPGIIGVSSGGGLAAVITMVMLPQFGYLLPVAAFLGAFITEIAIYLLACDQVISTSQILLD